MDDATETRIEKLYRIIEESRFGIHDISRTELDPTWNLPRFNMPIELGMFLSAKRFGGKDHEKKRAIIFDTEPYRFQRFASDLSGIDITPHSGDPREMVERVRNWLATVSQRKSISPTGPLLASYDRFIAALPALAGAVGLAAPDLTYPDYERLVIAWTREERAVGSL